MFIDEGGIIMFRRRFLIIEIRDNGMKIAHYIKGKKKYETI